MDADTYIRPVRPTRWAKTPAHYLLDHAEAVSRA